MVHFRTLIDNIASSGLVKKHDKAGLVRLAQ